MSRIALDLSQFKSAGVYTVEIDQTERIIVTTQSLRLVPGFSAKGPFNTPVFIRSNRDLSKFYGDLDRKLERKGSFFHRSIETCLLAAPVFALNLINVDDSPDSLDTVECFGIGLDCSAANDSSIAETDLFVNFFNRTRFWTPDTDYLQGVINNKYSASSTSDAPLFQIANVGTKKLSFIIRKAQGLTQYGVYAKEWYGSADNIPYEWIRPYDYISDYFIQVIAIEGDWTNYNSLSLDPYYTTYFSSSGIRPTQLQNFLNSANVTLVGAWTGCIIPDFRDQTGSEQYIETVVNAATPLTGILLNINHAALDQLVWDASDGQWEIGESTATGASYVVDLVGHNWIDQGDVSSRFLSYVIDASDSVIHTDVSAAVYPSTSTTYRTFSISASTNAYAITVGDLVKKSTTVAGATGIPGVTYVTNKYYDGSAYIVETAEAAYLDDSTDSLKVQKFIDDASLVSYYQFIKLDGLTISSRHTPGYDSNGAVNAEEGVEKIYSMLDDDGIYRGLTNPDMIDFRYIVDTMAYGLENQMGGKVYLSKLAKGRGKCTALINAPSISHFATSTNPYFCDTFVSGTDPVPVFSTEYIPAGGNPDMPRSFKFTLPLEVNGSKYCGVFGPFLRYNEGGKILNIPPAADVANAYIQKFLGGDPFAIVANRNGILSNPNIAGVEYMIDKTDRDYLEPFGYNSIIEKPASGQIMIYSNATAFQDVKSDFNNLHVRELLNTLEIQIESVLQPYVFNFNNAVTRLNIINAITPILQTTKDAGALQKYEVVMDETNNTADVIADGFGIVDINVWVTGALTKIVNRITLNTEAGISSGGFIF